MKQSMWRNVSVLAGKALAMTAVAAALAVAIPGDPVAAQGPKFVPGVGLVGGSETGGSAFDKTKFPQDRAALETAELRADFPKLGDDFEVMAPASKDYNAFSYITGDQTHWVNPEMGTPDAPLARIDQIFAAAGFTRTTGLDFGLEAGKQKAVLYASLNPDGTIKEITSAALQEHDGTWSSKLGSMALIRHHDPDALDGPVYGMPIAVYVRAAK
jgi:hypothetical protein